MEEMEEACKKALLAVDRIQKELVFQEALLEEKNSSLSSVRTSLQARYLEQNTAKLSLRQLNQKKEELTESSADMNLENRQLEEQRCGSGGEELEKVQAFQGTQCIPCRQDISAACVEDQLLRVRKAGELEGSAGDRQGLVLRVMAELKIHRFHQILPSESQTD